MSRTTVATIHLGALRHNLARIKELAAPAKVMAVVKADAYGHGLERVARALDGAADAFAVAALGDGLRLRAAGHRQRIVVLSGPDRASDIAEMQRLNLDAAIHHEAQLHWLKEASPARGALRVWLKVDSGMHRLGFAPEAVAFVHGQLAAMPGIDPEIGLLTHFAESEVFGGSQTLAQIARFAEATHGLRGPRSLSNSAATLWHPEAHFDWVRPGIILYGASPSGQWRDIANTGLRPVMTLSSEIIGVQTLKAGERVGYGGRYTARDEQRIGIVAAGYADGYPRHAPTGTPVLVDGVRTMTVGTVSMDMLAVDLTPCPQAGIGTPVELWGKEIKIDDVAAAAGTVGYELMCALALRVPVVTV